MHRTLARLAAAAALLAAAGPAHALLFRAYLASDGSDANPCTLVQPCRLLPAALAAVASGGEIWMLDSANYNTSQVVVGKSVTILAVPGSVGSIVSTGGAGQAAIKVTADDLAITLRNVSIGVLAGATPGDYGIYLGGISRVLLESSVIAGIPYEGARVEGEGLLRVVNSTIRNSGGWGINVHWGGQASISGSQILDNGDNVLAYGYTAATQQIDISDSVISGGFFGVHAFSSDPAGTARISVIRSKIDRNTHGIRSSTSGEGLAYLTFSGCLLTGNIIPWSQVGVGSFLYSMGDNHVANNGNPGTGTLNLLMPQ